MQTVSPLYPQQNSSCTENIPNTWNKLYDSDSLMPVKSEFVFPTRKNFRLWNLFHQCRSLCKVRSTFRRAKGTVYIVSPVITRSLRARESASPSSGVRTQLFLKQGHEQDVHQASPIFTDGVGLYPS